MFAQAGLANLDERVDATSLGRLVREVERLLDNVEDDADEPEEPDLPHALTAGPGALE